MLSHSFDLQDFNPFANTVLRITLLFLTKDLFKSSKYSDKFINVSINCSSVFVTFRTGIDLLYRYDLKMSNERVILF